MFLVSSEPWTYFISLGFKSDGTVMLLFNAQQPEADASAAYMYRLSAKPSVWCEITLKPVTAGPSPEFSFKLFDLWARCVQRTPASSIATQLPRGDRSNRHGF